MSNALTQDELTDATSEYLLQGRGEEPHKTGWIAVCGAFVDGYSVRDHAKTCLVCRNEMRAATGQLWIREIDTLDGRDKYVLSDGRIVVWSDTWESASQLLNTGETAVLHDEALVTALILETPRNG